MTTKLIVLACFLTVSQARELPMPRVIGGHDAQPGEFPFQVALLGAKEASGPYRLLCGGSIITEKWILTAAHCIKPLVENRNHSFIVVAGIHNTLKFELSQQTSKIASYFVHEYNKDFRADPFDLAMIKLANPFRFNKYVAPIRLPKRLSEPTGSVTLSGWGRTFYGPEYPLYPHILQKADLEIVDRSTCNQALEILAKKDGIKAALVSDNQICTGPLTGGFSACNGDSGGPLIRKDIFGNVEIIGIVSWGKVPCGRVGAPSVYVKVSSFISTIEYAIANF